MRVPFQLALVLSLCSVIACGQAARPDGEAGRQAYEKKDYAAAERVFREMVRRDPADIQAQMFLGHSLFFQQKYNDASGPYEKAMELEREKHVLTATERRVLTDQLAMSYGISGRLDQCEKLLREAIKKDPDYPLNYYNLACTFAERNDLDKTLDNLRLAFERKKNIIEGEQMPDPRKDDSFQKYVKNDRFKRLMKELGLN